MKKLILLILLILAALLGFSQKTNYPYRSDTTKFLSFDDTESSAVEKVYFTFKSKPASLDMTYKGRKQTISLNSFLNYYTKYNYLIKTYKVKDFYLLLNFDINTNALLSVGIAKNGNLAMFKVK